MSKASRRELLFKSIYGVGGLTLAAYMPGGGVFATPALAESLADPLAPKQPHFPPKVKSVIWLHMDGAPSTLDLYDYKPDLIKLAGQEAPPSFLNGIKTSTQGGVGKLFASNRTWKRYGQSGAWFSDLLPNLAQHADKINFIKSSTTIGATHDISILKLNTGDTSPGRPSLGAWVHYALGSANPDLPAYVVLYSGKKEPSGGSVNWSSGFLPAVYQGTAFRPGPSPILHLDRPELIALKEQRDDLDLLKSLNEHSASVHPEDSELQARLRSYELAYKMEATAPEAVDLSKESDATKALYGLDNEATKEYGTTLLRARRLVERNVRFIQVVSGAVELPGNEIAVNWDAHEHLESNHGAHARIVDQPIAGLLTDLKERGLLDTTLVVWTSEFGRTSYGQSGNGRDHNPWGYTQWLAGGGVKAGTTFGETDEIGLQSVGRKVDTYDLHATVLQLLGLDHLKTIYLRAGRSERPTVVYGEVIKELLA
ncbi:DUF1501 domain-containing protein [Methylocapsa palsarum]|uniref:Tat (Twin-arginine translocation) pathway signal sequence n=1 Tax=Methylocapsa palsarum TaxID=1612308 RepID=A0A1I3W1F4_9HYPH|nr:DUF1501 domain-containing protein [Methylocapsa palsarum]SFK00261.1 Protein of unknown function [Methylocapsa palsarum]